MRSLFVSPCLLLLALVLLQIPEPAIRADAAASVFPVAPLSDPVRSFNTDPNTTDDGFYIVDSVSTDFDNTFSTFPIPSHVPHSLPVKNEGDAREKVVHDPFYPYTQKRVSLAQTERMSYRVPPNPIAASSLPAELSGMSVTPDVAVETNVDFTLHPQSVEPYVSRLGTAMPSSVEVAPSLGPDFSPLPSVTSFSPAPEAPSSTIVKLKVPRGTFTPTTTTTVTPTRSTKKNVVFERDDASNTTIDSNTTTTETSSASLIIKKFTTFTTRPIGPPRTTSTTAAPSTTTTATPTTTTTTTVTTAATASPEPLVPEPTDPQQGRGDTPLPGIREATRTATPTTTSQDGRSRRRVCALFQFVMNQILKVLSRCQEPGPEDHENEQMQVKNGAPTEANGKSGDHDDTDFILDSLTDQFLMWAENLLQWLGALGRLMQSYSDNSHDVFLKIPTERV